MIQAISMNQLQPLKTMTAAPVEQATPAELTKTFSQFLNNAIEGVSAQEQNVHKLNDKFLIGEVDVSQVMIAGERAQLSLQLTSQIRNKVVEAYQEIMRMQV
ncbi:flagellar hook-basal body complex protein FliE [Paenibacillus sp. BIHB 4019]|uniref:Flagellar hook-basal body complex protein FliE n=1 Tax=Paenibacillus sp. BIHB 4019 TaxID=1870819 RepID=A0A1B2DPQ8_9BACL|nr:MULTISPECIES: flagellar hook-basal body complex protein FliE [unclassified Paenibacillus]ANY69678.1 flagellar hook-basal body complex protein FliE [Paenibacillus sp. BIHB 4019]KQO04424.1 flagellar hook-basal body protein FliE [Paenibacillus sp. Leaf72]